MLVFHSKPNSQSRVTIVGEYNDEGLSVTAARCGKRDNFSKKIGRAIASGRFNKNHFCLQIPTEERTVANFLNIANNLADQIAQDTKFKEHITSYTINQEVLNT